MSEHAVSGTGEPVLVDTIRQEAVPRWVWLNAGALLLVVGHMLIDSRIGLTGPSSLEMSGLQALDILFSALILGWWAAMSALAARGQRSGILGLFVLALLVSFAGHGLAAVGACPPPCEGAYPYQDIAHVANIFVGGAAAWTLYRLLRATPGRGPWWAIAVPVALQIASWITTTALVLG